jgi:hypothetical protein
MFLEDPPPAGTFPRHLDPLLGHPCPASGRQFESYLEIPEPPEHPDDWPRWDPRHLANRRRRRALESLAGDGAAGKPEPAQEPAEAPRPPSSRE